MGSPSLETMDSPCLTIDIKCIFMRPRDIEIVVDTGLQRGKKRFDHSLPSGYLIDQLVSLHIKFPLLS